MKSWFVIPITKEELVKTLLITFFILPVIGSLYFYVIDWAIWPFTILIFWIFPLMFLPIVKDEYDWDFHIKIKFFEGRD